MKTNYQSLPHEELDRLAATRVMGWDYNKGYPAFKFKTGVTDPNGMHEEEAWDLALDPDELWRPSHKDSAQCQNYLFRKLVGCYIIQDGYGRDFAIRIHIETARHEMAEVSLECTNPDDINKTCVAAVLEAWDKLGESK